MSTVSFGGLVSGLDTDTIVSQLIALEHRPIDLLDEQQTNDENLLSVFQELNSKFLSLKTQAETLNEAEIFQAVTVTSSDDTILIGTGGSSLNTGVYTIEVTQLAQTHELSSDPFTDGTSSLKRSGDLVINGKTITLEATDSFNNIRDKINSTADVGVSASVLQVSGTDYRLILTSEETGSLGGITIDDTTVAQRLGFIDDDGAIKNELESAQDATIKIGQANPITITRSSNTIDDVIEGVTLNLKQAEPGTRVNLTVSSDTDSVKQSIQDFVDTYNEVLSYLKEQMSYDEENDVRGALMGDFTARTVKSTLQKVIVSEVGGLSGSLTALSRIGITSSASGGTLSIDDTRLTSALTNNLTDVKDLFIGLTDNLTNTLESFTDPYDGLIAHRIEGTQNTIDDLQDRMDTMETRVSKREEQIRAQFQAMEIALSQLQSQSAFLTQQINILK